MLKNITHYTIKKLKTAYQLQKDAVLWFKIEKQQNYKELIRGSVLDPNNHPSYK